MLCICDDIPILWYIYILYYYICFLFLWFKNGGRACAIHLPHTLPYPTTFIKKFREIDFFFQFHEFFFFWTPPYVLSRPVFLKDSIFIISTFFRIKKPDRHTVSYFNVYTFSIWILLLRKMTKYLAFKRWFQYKNSIIRHFKKFLLFFCNCDLKKSPFFSV